MTAEEVRIGGKYTPVREISRAGNVTLHEVTGEGGEPLRLAQFEIDTPEQRQAFFAYRDALTALRPLGLVELVARPEASYAVWRKLEGQSLEEFAALKSRREDALDSLRLTTQHLAEHGYALPDAEICMTGRARTTAGVAYLAPAPRKTEEEIARLNAPVLRPLLMGRTRRRPSYLAWLAPLPGLLMLTAAGWYGYQAVQEYLSPPVGVVADVTGMPANKAAQTLAAEGFRVAYSDGEGQAAIGAVLRQEPEIGTNLPLGRLVTLTVNSPPDLTVPRVEDLTPERAAVNLKESGFRLGKVTKVDGTATQTPQGRIIAQDPPAGLSTQRGQGVNVLVSTGISGKETWLPDLTGLDFTSAREHARTAGLVVTEVKQEESNLPENTVIAQEPAPFTRVPGGDPVVLTVAAPKFANPPAGLASLPVPPPYVPPVRQRAPQQDWRGPQGTQAPGRGVTPPDSTFQPQEGTTGAERQPAPTPNTPAPSNPVPNNPLPNNPAPEETTLPTAPNNTAAPEDNSRTVALNYSFPANLPEGNYSIVVQDAAGQRIMMGATPSSELAGAIASNSAVTVSGDAVFYILRDGQVYTTVQPQ